MNISDSTNRPEVIAPVSTPPNEQTAAVLGLPTAKYSITVQPYLQNPLYAFEAKARWGNRRASYSLAKYGPDPEIALEKLHRALAEIDGEIEFDDSTAAPLVRGVIPGGFQIAVLAALILHVALGAFFAVVIIAPDFIEIAAKAWGLM